MVISFNSIWVENCENCKPTFSFENKVNFFGGIEGNIWEPWEVMVERVRVFDIK